MIKPIQKGSGFCNLSELSKAATSKLVLNISIFTAVCASGVYMAPLLIAEIAHLHASTAAILLLKKLILLGNELDDHFVNHSLGKFMKTYLEYIHIKLFHSSIEKETITTFMNNIEEFKFLIKENYSGKGINDLIIVDSFTIKNRSVENTQLYNYSIKSIKKGVSYIFSKKENSQKNNSNNQQPSFNIIIFQSMLVVF